MKEDPQARDETHSSALAALGERAARDSAFRKKLLKDPHAALRDVTDLSIPPTLKIKFIEKDPNVDVMIVLPDPILEDGELTEDEVAAVAGGTNWGCQDVSTA